MEATNGVIHMIEAPLPIYILNYDDDDDHDDDDEVCITKLFSKETCLTGLGKNSHEGCMNWYLLAKCNILFFYFDDGVLK